MENDSDRLRNANLAIMKIAGHVVALEAAMHGFRDSLKVKGISIRVALPPKLNVLAIRKLLEG